MSDAFFDMLTAESDAKRIGVSALSSILKRQTDRISSSLSYIGEAGPGATNSQAVWRIRREMTQDTLTIVSYAAKDFSSVWNDRASLTYDGAGTATLQNNYSVDHDGINDATRSSVSGILNYDRLNAFSCFGWVKFDALGATIRYLFGKNSSGTSFLGYGIEYNSGAIRVNIANTVVAAANGIVVQSSPALLINTWYHIGFTYDGSSNASGVNIYINGVGQATAAIQNNLTATIASASIFFGFGARNGLINFLDGKVDEVGVFNKSLSLAEAVALYNSGAPYDILNQPLLPDCDAFWRCGDGDFDSGTNLVDVVNDAPMLLLNGAMFILDGV